MNHPRSTQPRSVRPGSPRKVRSLLPRKVRSLLPRKVRTLFPRKVRSLFPRKARIMAAPLLASAILAAAPIPTVAASTPTASPSQASLQTQAQELAGQIEAEGQNLDRVAEAVNAAQIRASRLTAQMSALQATMARTSGQVVAARAALREQAVLAYISGGAPLADVVPGKAGEDPSLTIGYADIIADGQQRALNAYRAVLVTQQQQAFALSAAQAQVTATLAELQADRNSAAQAMTARQQTLAQVKGQLAVLVAQVQRTQQLAQQKALEANLAQRQDMPPPSPMVVDPPPSTTTTTRAADPPPAPPTTRPTPNTSTPATTQAPTTPPTTRPPTTTTTVPSPPPGNQPARGWQTAVHYAYAQLGKPYQWGGAGPNSFDCSGLTMMAWAAAGVYFPHLAQDQYDMTRRIPLYDVLPGDLIFFGTPDNVYHVGIYIGGGQMIDAPETGQDVSISSIYWTDLLGAGRVID